MSNESVVTQWQKYSWGGWWRNIGTEAATCVLSADRPFGTWWCWKVTVPPAEDYEIGGNASTAGDAKRAATEAGYALLKRLESEQGSMDFDKGPLIEDSNRYH